MTKGAWILALALALVTAVHAQAPRQFPPGSKLGELAGQSQPYPMVQIGDKVLRLSPGARIFDEHNRIIMHSYLPRQAHVVYAEDTNGQVSRVYILRPAELAEIQRTAPR
jgi:hypothetical protein